RNGIAHANGLVPITLPAPPKGATAGPALHQAIPIWPDPAMVATYSPTRPTWLQALMETTDTPWAAASSVLSLVASCAAGWPKPQAPSTVATAPCLDATSGWPSGRICPLLTQSEYWRSR